MMIHHRQPPPYRLGYGLIPYAIFSLCLWAIFIYAAYRALG